MGIIFLTSDLMKAFRGQEGGGGGVIQSIGQEIACHFSQDPTMVTK